MVHQVYLGLGSNLGDGRANLERAVSLIGERVGQVTRQSSFVTSRPWGFESPHLFTNAVILCETTQSPREVLATTQQIERDMGRTKKTPASQLSAHTYSDRVIDIDSLLYDGLTIDEPDLKVPHPLMHQRDFVMRPLEEIYSKH